MVPHIAMHELLPIWKEVGIGWNPQFQAVNGGWKLCADFTDLQSGSMG